ncbi:MAG: hypothetical protein WDW38_010976 [Sanguina aurantia]
MDVEGDLIDDVVSGDADNSELLEEVPNSEGMEDTVQIQVSTPGQDTDVVPMDAQDECSGTYTWKVPRLSKSMGVEKLYSDKFEIGTYFWRLLLPPTPPLSMSPKANFTLKMINKLDPARSMSKDSNHTFTSNEADWGFNTFAQLDEVLQRGSGFLEDDVLELRVDITIQKDDRYAYDSRKETGFVGIKNQGATCYLNSLLQYLYNLPYFRKAVFHMPTPESEDPSKSLPLALQSVFYKLQYSKTSVSTKDLTKSFGWGTYDAFQQHDVQELNRVLCEKLEEKMKGTCVENTVNQLFEGHTFNYLSCINVACESTRKESYLDLQLDVKGCRNIHDSFDRYCEVEVMDGANQYNTDTFGLQDAKKGVKFESFPSVLQLQLKRFEYDFQRDTMVKINDRYEFFDELDLDREEFRYLSDTASRTGLNKYRLHSVLVHSGGVHGGHYYAYVRPDGKQWLKFEDDRVTKEEPHRAMEEQFGGEDDSHGMTNSHNTFHAHNPPPKLTKHSNAYMLVYVRGSDWDRIMCPVAKEDVTEHLREQLEHEQREKEERQKNKAEAHLYCTLKVVTDADMVAQVGKSRFFDLADHDKVAPAQGHFRMRKQVKFSDFKNEVAARYGVPVEQQRFWSWQKRANSTERPMRPLTAEEEDSPLMDLREHREAAISSNKHALMDLKLYLETPVEGETTLLKLGKDDIMVFIKHYDPVTETLRLVGHLILPRTAKVGACTACPPPPTLPGPALAQHPRRTHPALCGLASVRGGCLSGQRGDTLTVTSGGAVGTRVQEMLPLAAHRAGLDEHTQLDVYEEVKSEPTVYITLLDQRKTLHFLEMENGDILVLQPRLGEAEAASLRHPTVLQYLTYVCALRKVTWKRREEPKAEGIVLEMSKDMSYDQVTEALAAALSLDDPAKLRLTQHNNYGGQPQRTPLRFRGLATLEQMLTHSHHTLDTVYYEVLDIPLAELETLKTLKVTFHGDKSEHLGDFSVRLPKNGCVSNVLTALQQQLQGPLLPYATRPLRLLETLGGKIYKVLTEDEAVDNVNDNYWTLRIEPIPEDQLELAPTSRVINVQHVHPPPADVKEESQPRLGAQLAPTCFGHPFLLTIAEADTLEAVKAKVQAKLEIAPEEFSKWQAVFVSTRQATEQLTDDSLVVAELFVRAHNGTQGFHDMYLGFVHEDRHPKRSNNSNNRHPYETPIKIYS